MCATKRAQRVFDKFWYLLGKCESGGLSSIEIPIYKHDVPTGAYEWVHDPDRIVKLIIHQNQQHFSQARGPFTDGPVLKCVGRNAEHSVPGIQRALLLPNLSPATKCLLNQLIAPPLPPISCIISATDLEGKFKTWKESTSTSPQGTPLGHYKALLLKDILDIASEPNYDLCAYFFEIFVHLLTTSFSTGCVAKNWLLVHSTMLEKVPGDPKFNHLRVIHIFDALWNAGIGILWSRRLMPQCERFAQLHGGQWGSRKGKKAIDCVMLKQLTYKVAHYTRTDLVTFDNNAKSCYNQIVMSHALAR